MSNANLLDPSHQKERRTIDPQSPIDSLGSRAAILSPTSGHRDYNRFKYYSALRTGYKHLGQESNSFLEPPKHVIDPNLFVFYNPFSPPRKSLLSLCDNRFSIAAVGEKQSSMVIIFSAWKTMVGASVTSLPWAF